MRQVFTVQFVFFILGACISALIAFFISRRSANETQTVLSQDTSLEKRVTEDLASQLMDILDVFAIGVVFIDYKNNHRAKNKAASSMTGVRYVDILVDQAVDEMVTLVAELGHGDRVFDAVAGTTRFFRIHGEKLRSQSVIVTIEDITEKSRIETVQTDFVANLSHELKTPIGAIAALADSLTGETETDVAWRLAERIVTESHRMSRIVDDLLDLSRLEFGGTEDWTNIDLGHVLVEAVSTNQHSAKRQGLNLSLSNTGNLFVRGERSQLISVFSNLIENAIKYSETGNVVLVESLGLGNEMVVNVIDHGIGIAEHDQKRIFERFYRVDRARSRATGGTGLGLSIVRHIVLEHGGSIEVVSEEGIGSTFTVRLPQVSVKPAPDLVDDLGALT